MRQAALCTMFLLSAIASVVAGQTSGKAARLPGRDGLVAMVGGTGEVVASTRVATAACLRFAVTASDCRTGFGSQDQARGTNVRTAGYLRVTDGAVVLPGNAGRRLVNHHVVSSNDDRMIQIMYQFRFPEEVTICGYCVSLMVGIEPVIGHEIVALGLEDRSVMIGPSAGEPVLIVGRAGEVTASPGEPDGILLACDDVMDFWLQAA